MISGMAAPITVLQTGCHSLPGRIRLTASSGMTTSSSTTVCEPVARIPSVSHVSSMLTPSVANGTAAWITCGPSGASSQRMLVTRMSPAGAPLAGALRPDTRNPVSVFVAVPFDSIQSEAPVDTSTSCLSATFASTGAGMPRWWRQTCAAMRCVCMESASEVAGQPRARIARTAQASAWVAPPPPSSLGTSIDMKPRRRSRAKPSWTNAPLSSSAAAFVERDAATSSASTIHRLVRSTPVQWRSAVCSSTMVMARTVRIAGPSAPPAFDDIAWGDPGRGGRRPRLHLCNPASACGPESTCGPARRRAPCRGGDNAHTPMDSTTDLPFVAALDDADTPGDVIDLVALGPFLAGDQPVARSRRLTRLRADAALAAPGRRPGPNRDERAPAGAPRPGRWMDAPGPPLGRRHR